VQKELLSRIIGQQDRLPSCTLATFIQRLALFGCIDFMRSLIIDSAENLMVQTFCERCGIKEERFKGQKQTSQFKAGQLHVDA
jgi:hypothetical protein